MGQSQTLLTRTSFLLKVFGLTIRRALQNFSHPIPSYTPSSDTPMVGHREEIVLDLYVDERPEEHDYELGKVHNLRQAIRSFNGITLPAGAVFSFWRQLGPATRARGFVTGRMLQLGCVVPAVGGGLCQLSNALYELALRTGCDILERHPHSHRLPGSPLRDATVAYNYIDLRFRTLTPIRIEIQLTSKSLIVVFICESLPVLSSPELLIVPHASAPKTHTCATCNESSCTRHEPVSAFVKRGRRSDATAFLVDTRWPEFDRYLQQTRSHDDWLFVPIAGGSARRTRLPQYAWSTAGFAHVRTYPFTALLRSLKVRRLASQGAARQSELLRTSAAIASAMAAGLPHRVSHLVIDQTLLPALWQSGVLGGRTFDVLLHRLPIDLLHKRLDQVAACWPNSPTAADFRAPSTIAEAERQALAAARHLITPHRELASLFPSRAIKLDWQLPDDFPNQQFTLQNDQQTPRFFFPGPTAARKGAYVLREAARGLDLEVLWRGSELEGADFWQCVPNHRVEASGRRPPNTSPISVTGIVQPSYLEDQPRLLLRALAAGIPVFTTHHAGLDPHPKLHLVNPENQDELRATLLQQVADPMTLDGL